jgi:RNA polymerase sigma-70 factor (ECF subfamily)
MSSAMVPDISAEGSANDLEELFRQYHQLIYRTAYSVTGTHQDAEDVLQTIFLRLMKGVPSRDLRSHPKTYLYRSAVNEALTTVRTRQRRRVEEGVDVFQVPLLDEKANEDEQREAQLIAAMAQLNPETVEILILRYEHDYSDAEIARLLGRSRPAIAVALFRARGRLRKLLTSRQGEAR